MAGPYRFRVRRINPGSDPVLLEGEPGYDTATGHFKMGDGSTSWLLLPAFVPGGGSGSPVVVDGGVSDETLLAAINAHIGALNPHPVYDEGPSLLLLYQNAKV